jgi:nucleotide-binding universal stress UspA family protein
MNGSIVVGTDGSPTAMAAVEKAGALARLSGAKLTVVAAYKDVTSVAAGFTGHVTPPLDDAQPAAEAALREAEQRLRAEGVDCDTRAVAGGAADALIEVARIENAEAIVVGSRGMRGVRRVLGSVPNDVSHRAPCSVYIVKTDD